MKVCRPVIVKLLTVVRVDQPADAGLLPSAEGRRVDGLGALSGTAPSGRLPPPSSPPPPPPPPPCPAEAVVLSLPTRTEARWLFRPPPLCTSVRAPWICIAACSGARPRRRPSAVRCVGGPGQDQTGTSSRHERLAAFFFPSPLPYVSLAAGGGARAPSALDGAARAVDVGRPNRVFLDGRRAGWVAPVSLPARHDGNCCGAAPFVGAGMGALWDGRDARCGPRRRHL